MTVTPVDVLTPVNDGASCGRLLNADYLKKKKKNNLNMGK
jgi:hypothetical protein